MDNHTQQDEIVIDLRELFAIVLKKLWIVIIVSIGLGVVAYLLSHYVLVPKYQSTTQLYVINKQDENASITYSDLQSGTQLTKDYMMLITSRPVVEQVIAELNLNMKYQQIVDMISVTNPDNTRILAITVEYTDPFMAKEIADAIRVAAGIHIKNVMNIDQVNVVEEANIPEGPFSPNTKKHTMIGSLLGVLLAVAIITVIYILDDTLKTPDDIEKYLGLSVLSSIPIQAELKERSNNKRKAKRKEKK